MSRWSQYLHYDREQQDYSCRSRLWINVVVCLVWIQTMRQTWPGLHLLPHLNNDNLHHQVSISAQILHITAPQRSGVFFSSVSLTEWIAGECVGGRIGELLLYIPYMYFTILPNVDSSSSSVSAFWIWELDQVWKLGKIMILGELPSALCSSTHDLLWLYKVRIILIGCPFIFPLGTLCFICHVPWSLWVRPFSPCCPLWWLCLPCV